jgi:hypothetical protein
VARHIFHVYPVWMYTQSNITQAFYSPEYITPTQQINTINFKHILHLNILITWPNLQSKWLSKMAGNAISDGLNFLKPSQRDPLGLPWKWVAPSDPRRCLLVSKHLLLWNLLETLGMNYFIAQPIWW